MLEGIRRGDAPSWERFYQRYKTLVYLRGKAWHFSPADIDDLVVDVMSRFFPQSGKFAYDPSKGRFRDYFGRIVRNAAIDLMRRNRRNTSSLDAGEDGSTIDIPDPAVDESWKRDWQSKIFAEALTQIRLELPVVQVQCWEACRIQRIPAAKLAKFHHLSLATVYNYCQRVWDALQLRVQKLSEEE